MSKTKTMLRVAVLLVPLAFLASCSAGIGVHPDHHHYYNGR